MKKLLKSQIIILDFGSQYTHLIARRIRQLGVLATIYPPDVSPAKLKGAKGLILSGGPQSVHDQTAIKYNQKIFNLDIPILGLCYGHQLIVRHFGGEVKPGETKEYGFAIIEQAETSQLFNGLEKQEKVWMSHGDTAAKLPTGFVTIAQTADCPIAAMADEERSIYGLQFHPEVTHTLHGMKILENFVFNICQCEKDWSMELFWRQIVKQVKETVDQRYVFLLVSGGVDSTVAFAILEKILGKQRVFGLHIDTGFVRLNESAQVKESLAKAGFDDLEVLDASDDFFKALEGVVEPEKKREIIGQEFLKIKDNVMKSRNMNPINWVIGQGTIYPDTIETGGTKHADKIKTHHNRVKEVMELMEKGQLIEPLVDLYKDEVRELGKNLGLPDELLNRHPFPGPGLAIRALCSDGNQRSVISDQRSVNQKIKKVVGDKLEAIVLPIKSVGVQGDNRTYRHPVLIQGKADWQELHDLSVRLTNELIEVNRVVYLVSPKKIDFEKLKIIPAYLTKERLDLLRQVDHLVNQETRDQNIYQDIWQFPVILAPLSLSQGETVILRPIQSQEAMTVNFYEMDQKILDQMTQKITAIKGIDLVLYDVTNKPPGTIEWE